MGLTDAKGFCIDKQFNTLVIDAAKTNNVKKFINISSMFCTRPNSFVGWLLNSLGGNGLGH